MINVSKTSAALVIERPGGVFGMKWIVPYLRLGLNSRPSWARVRRSAGREETMMSRLKNCDGPTLMAVLVRRTLKCTVSQASGYPGGGSLRETIPLGSAFCRRIKKRSANF